MVDYKNILVTGSNGQLGSTLMKISYRYSYNFYFTDSNELDITNYRNVETYLINNNINVIINCAAYTDVNNAEKNKELANNVNHWAVNNLAKLCKRDKIQLIHISTDYVFDGNKSTAYLEEDNTNPINYYGTSKLLGEKKILKYDLEDSIIIRTSWLYSHNKNNFVNKIIKKIKNVSEINVVDNEIGSPTNAIDLANTILEIIPKINNRKTEIYHYSNSGFCSRYVLAVKINDLLGENLTINSFNKIRKEIKRPKFSVLNNNKIVQNFDIRLKSWQESLKDFVKLIKVNCENGI